jgi:hypothetical protein
MACQHFRTNDTTVDTVHLHVGAIPCVPVATLEDVNDDWLARARRESAGAALTVARRQAAEQLVAGPVIAGPGVGQQLTADRAIEILVNRDNKDPMYGALKPYERQWALLVLRIVFDSTVTNEAVSDARRRDTTWAAIGQALGVTPQAAQRRYGKHVIP